MHNEVVLFSSDLQESNVNKFECMNVRPYFHTSVCFDEFLTQMQILSPTHTILYMYGNYL